MKITVDLGQILIYPPIIVVPEGRVGVEAEVEEGVEGGRVPGAQGAQHPRLQPPPLLDHYHSKCERKIYSCITIQFKGGNLD